MEQTHDLLFELVGGPNPPTDSRFIPTVATQRFVFQLLLIKSVSVAQDITAFLARIKPTVRTSITEFQNLVGADNLDELTALGNASRNVLLWIQEIEASLEAPDKIQMISRACGPMAWLEALIKTLEFKAMAA